MVPTILTLLAMGTAVFAIRGEYQSSRTHVYIFKPATTLLIILLALQGSTPDTPAYKWLVVAGLILCLAGDVFLMLPPRYFTLGLGSFLAGHWFYIAAFTIGGATYSWWLLPLTAVWGHHLCAAAFPPGQNARPRHCLHCHHFAYGVAGAGALERIGDNPSTAGGRWRGALRHIRFAAGAGPLPAKVCGCPRTGADHLLGGTMAYRHVTGAAFQLISRSAGQQVRLRC